MDTSDSTQQSFGNEPKYLCTGEGPSQSTSNLLAARVRLPHAGDGSWSQIPEPLPYTPYKLPILVPAYLEGSDLDQRCVSPSENLESSLCGQCRNAT